MYNANRIGVVVPAYNEEDFVGEVLETIPAFVDRVYVVDDASTDGTWEEITEHVEGGRTFYDDGDDSRAEDDGTNRIVAIRHPENRGVGGAIKSGYARAVADDIDAVAVMSGDGQMDPNLLDRILEPVVTGEADYAKGNRLVYPEYRAQMSRWRFFGNAVLSLLTKVASGYWRISDAQNGYTAISTDALERIAIENLYDDYGFANDLLIKLNAQNMRIADLSMTAVYGDESSSIRYRSFVPKLSLLLLSGFLWRLKMKYVAFEFNSLVLYYLLGVLSMGTGIAAGMAGVWQWFATNSPGVPFTDAALLIFLGGFSLSTAMYLDREASADLEFRLYEPPTTQTEEREEPTTTVIEGDQQ